MKDLRGKRVLVVGFARSGREAARCLARRGAVVTVTDTRPPSAFAADIPELVAQRVGLELGRHCEETFLRHDLIVVSPGVPWDSPYLAAARRRKIPVLPEVELAAGLVFGTLVGITGSNGKTTTTALLGKILEASGLPAFVGGNIGVPLISAVDHTSAETLLVTELSSFQLEAAEDLHPRVAVLLNLTPNHLDRHPSFEAYAEAKARIFRRQTADDCAVLNADDPRVAALAPQLAARKVFFSRRRNLAEGLMVADGRILYRVGNLERVLLATSEVPLRGAFNVENVLAAAAAACLLGVDFAALRRAVRDFRGVEHRLEFVREISGVSFFNDSKATSVDAAAKALSAFEGGVHLILGGKDKGAPYAPLLPMMKSRVRAAYLIGAAAERMARELAGGAELVPAGDLETAVRKAFARAAAGDSVLLAPACSSYDQFQDFEHRGCVFKEIVTRLAEEPAPPVLPARAAASGEVSQSPAARQEAGLALPARPELAYVYEVSGEDAAPLDFQPSEDSDFPPLDPAELRVPESVEDEALMFEIRPAGNGGSAAKPIPAGSKVKSEENPPRRVGARGEKS